MATVVLNEVEARLLGVLIEKELTTPDQYPLSTRALQAGSNQKSNRHPHTTYGEAEVLVGAQGLEAKGLATRIPPGMGARVERFEHRAQHALSLDRAQLAVLAELLLRGPQQPGELRTRANRMSSIDTLQELGLLLEKLIQAKLVKRLAPSPGTRAERYRELLSSPVAAPGATADGPSRPATPEEIVRLHDERARARKAEKESTSAAEHAASAVESTDPEPTRVAPTHTAPTADPPEPREAATQPGDARVEALEARVAELERRLATLLERLGEEV